MDERNQDHDRDRYRCRCHGQQGLTLLEVLISLTIVSIVFFSVNVLTNTTRDKVDEMLNLLEQSIRYAQHEAVLRNTMIRVRLVLDADPQEYVVEAGPTGDFVLPLFDGTTDYTNASLIEQDKRDKIIKGLGTRFQKVAEFEKSNGLFSEQVKIIGVASALTGKIVQDGEFSFYVYPEGEKDAGLIVLGTSNELVSLSISPFVDSFERTYHSIEAKDDTAVIEEQERVAREMYENWMQEGK